MQTPSTAKSKSQSSKNIFADFPPNSKVKGIILLAAANPTVLPTSVLQVKANMDIFFYIS